MSRGQDDSLLSKWNFEYLNEQNNMINLYIPPGCQFWKPFEHFVADFRALKSNIYELGEQINLSNIHHGAKHTFDQVVIINQPLALPYSKHRVNTKSSNQTN